jgi:CheY-like chemotaxis protein
MTTRTVLIVDDEDDIRQIARLSLERVAGWTVHTASSGAEGVEVAARVQPDAVLLDVMMPDLDGPGTVALLRERPETRDLPVVMLTAKVQAQDRRQFDGLGVKGVVAKPFDPMTLHRDIAEQLGWGEA